jgi:hypothetical protein
MTAWYLPEPQLCTRCQASPCALPLLLADGRPSGHLCRECLVFMHTLGTKAMLGTFGPQVGSVDPGLLLDDELFWIEAATEEPRTLDLEAIKVRWRERLARKYTVRPDHMTVDHDALRDWPTGGH